jgi:light-independent protochlorophyllide reductase subunit B
MGLEEHLLHMFREDFEFHDGAGPSHLSGHAPVPQREQETPAQTVIGEIMWEAAAEKELRKIPFFVRGKARRNTEKFASDQGLAEISVETLYDAKAHYAR